MELLGDKYVIYRKDRNNFGGGVVILIKQEFNTEAYNNDLSAEEAGACKFTLGKHEVVICYIHRPPNVVLNTDMAITNYIDNMCSNFSNARMFIFQVTSITQT